MRAMVIECRFKCCLNDAQMMLHGFLSGWGRAKDNVPLSSQFHCDLKGLISVVALPPLSMSPSRQLSTHLESNLLIARSLGR